MTSKIAFRDSGTAGRDVVHRHGVFANFEYHEPLAGHKADEYRVVGYNLRGHGRSGTRPVPRTTAVTCGPSLNNATSTGRS